jgi:succinate dehydrogenase / fumarate reductase, iron-sulfur subunit
MKIRLEVWRQPSKEEKGAFAQYDLDDINPNMSFLEMLDTLNEMLIKKNEDPVAFDHDCREGICGSCGVFINGQAHGPDLGTATCQLYMRRFRDGDTIIIEPWRAKAFPVIKDLVVNRSAFDRIQAAGGYTGAKTGGHPDGNSMLVSKEAADQAMDMASCIGCGACVAACPNASASLFTAAKISQHALLPQGQPLREARVFRMVRQMDLEGFGNCTNIGECRSACPAEISIDSIARMRREYLRALAKHVN